MSPWPVFLAESSRWLLAIAAGAVLYHALRRLERMK